MPTRDYVCELCGRTRTLSADVVAKYPSWVPKRCMGCRDGGRQGSTTRGERHSPVQAQQRFTQGPGSGIFTDGFCEPNPGTGGWGVVRVDNDSVVEERCGGDPDSTNNRMELQAIIEAYKMIGHEEEAVIYTDSQLSLNTITKWAAGWKRNGWMRKNGKKREPVKNLDLVQEAFELAQVHPNVRIEWIEGHAGNRWNEYADALSRKGADDQ